MANNFVLTHRANGGLEIAFTVPINIVKALLRTGEYVNPIYPSIFTIGINKTTNVAGLFGESIYCLGKFGGILYLVVLFFITYLLFIQFKIYGRYKLCMSYLFAVLLFSFFCNFFTVSGVVLPLLFLFAFESIIQLIRGMKNVKGISCHHIKLERFR